MMLVFLNMGLGILNPALVIWLWANHIVSHSLGFVCHFWIKTCILCFIDRKLTELIINRINCFLPNVFLFFFFFNFFIFGCVGSSLLRVGFLRFRWLGATLRCSAWASHCGGFSCCGAWALRTWASVVAACRLYSAGSVVMAHGLSWSAACGIFLDQGSNPCPLHWQADP